MPQLSPKHILLSVLLIPVLIIVVVQIFFIGPMMRLHTLDNQPFLRDFMFRQFRGCRDPKALNALSGRSEKMKLAFWYMYYHIRTEDLIFFTLFNLANMFSDKVTLVTYGYDYKQGSPFEVQIPLRFSEIEFIEEGRTVTVKHTSIFRFTLDFDSNILTYELNHASMRASYRLKVTDWNTNQASFLPQYRPLRLVSNLDGHETETPGEWMVDSPALGDVLEGEFQGRKLGGGQFWFDVYTGTNYHFLSPYTWFYIHTQDWLIYLLQYSELGVGNPLKKTSPILIKDLKHNKWYVSGAHRPVPQPFMTLRNITDPMSLDIAVNGALGDDFVVRFKARDIQIELKSRPGTIRPILKYFYYKDDGLKLEKLAPSDREYVEDIQRIRFEENLCECDVTITRDGSTERFRARTLYEGMRIIN